ncbi:MAG: ABC transporter permease [Bosea sp. (in: a-proteobacteria)]
MSIERAGMLRFAPVLVAAIVVGPIFAGLVGTLLPAFGYLPAVGRTEPGLAAWRELWSTPGFGRSLMLTTGTGLAATVLSLACALGFVATMSHRAGFRRVESVLAPLLAAPHAAIAIGFAFLVLPSGWIARAISPELTGWLQPPAIATVRDPAGISLVIGLMLKEIPYLTIMIAGALTQIRFREHIAVALALGYSRPKAWLVTVFPLVYRQIRLPVYAVLSFSLSVVDMAYVLGPGAPAPLAILAARWFADYDLALYPRAAAAAVLQCIIVISAIGVWRLIEIVIGRIASDWATSGRRNSVAGIALWTGCIVWLALTALAFFSIGGLGVWSLAGDWRFPDAWPDFLTAETWVRQSAEVFRHAATTLAIGLAATGVALAASLAMLECESRHGARGSSWLSGLIYAPLIVPQIAFVFGLQVLLVRIGADGFIWTVAWVHVLFVLPYLHLALADPYHALDPHFVRTARALGAAPWRVFWRIKLPILLRPILIACAVGFTVSVAQYLPTLFAGAGRVPTLTTEALTLSSGSDRRILGVYGALQTVLPLLAYLAAALLPAFLHRHRKGLA